MGYSQYFLEHDNNEESVLNSMMVVNITCLALNSVIYSALAL